MLTVSLRSYNIARWLGMAYRVATMVWMSKSCFKERKRTKFTRTGVLTTRRGNVLTPTFMPVGTRGAVKLLEPAEVAATGAKIVLGNTYHLHLQPGEDLVARAGGLHGFSTWSGPMLTDSGGFQVFSLAHSRKITEEGVTFKDPKTGDKIFISPEISMQIQLKLGADIIMAFDDLTGLDGKSRARAAEAVDRTHRWLERCVSEFNRLTKDMEDVTEVIHEDDGQGDDEQRSKSYKKYDARAAESPTQTGASSDSKTTGFASGQSGAVNKLRRPLLFGIIQGGLDKELRRQSIEFVQSQPVDGIAIGGLSVGETRAEMHDILEFLSTLYDYSRPHYLMGVGDPIDMRFAIEHGIDMFDCVLPTRNGRHGSVWILSDDNKINLKSAEFASDLETLQQGCDCHTCLSGYSRAFLRHQFKVGEPLAGRLCSIHNLRFVQRICEEYQATE